MKTTYSDLETRWVVSIETSEDWPYGRPSSTWTITHPGTGKTAWRLVLENSPEPDIPTWVRNIRVARDYETDRRQKVDAFLHRTYPELAEGASLPRGPLPRIKFDFARQFGLWEIALPETDVRQRRRGKICQAGWAIWYLFGADDRGEYLDSYASHRMTNDSHQRLYEDGHSEGLEPLSSMRRGSQDPEEDARLLAAFRAENRRIQAVLEAKGFGLAGDEPGSVQIQRYQLLREDEEGSG